MTAHGQPGGCDLRCEKMRRPSSGRLWHWQLRRLTHFGKLFRSVPFHSLSVPIPLSDVRRYCKILIFNRYYRYYPILTGIGKIHILSDMIRFIQWTVWNNGKTRRDLAKKNKCTVSKLISCKNPKAGILKRNCAVVEAFVLPILHSSFWMTSVQSSAQDPYLRCTWDNMVMLSPIVKQSLRPVFNQSFYFPVRAPWLSMSTF